MASPKPASPLDELKITVCAAFGFLHPELLLFTAISWALQYMNFVTFGDKTNAGLMSGKVWAKLCKDCNLLDKALTPAIVDLVFNAIKPKGGRTITFKVFCEGLDKLGSYKYPAEFKSGGAAATTPKVSPFSDAISGFAGHCNSPASSLCVCADSWWS
jgi:hypothetical protein